MICRIPFSERRVIASVDTSLKHKTPVVLIAPETAKLPDKMGLLAKYISGKSGGMGDVVASLCEGLTQRGIECHIATLNLRRRFKAENKLDEDEWHKIRHTVDPECIHLVSSSVFADLPSAYAGDPLRNAAEFQKTLVNQIIVDIRAKYGGKIIIHSHDWMAGGAVTAYAKLRGCPVLHTIMFIRAMSHWKCCPVWPQGRYRNICTIPKILTEDRA
jgi:glycogen synthase